MGPTRLTIVVDSDVYGGAEAYAAHLLRRLPERFERTLLATPGVPEQLRRAAGDALVTFERPRGKTDVARLAGAARALRGTRPDLVHVNMATAANNRHVIGLCGLLRLRAVATLHVVAPLESTAQIAILRRAYRSAGRADRRLRGDQAPARRGARPGPGAGDRERRRGAAPGRDRRSALSRRCDRPPDRPEGLRRADRGGAAARVRGRFDRDRDRRRGPGPLVSRGAGKGARASSSAASSTTSPRSTRSWRPSACRPAGRGCRSPSSRR